MAWLSGWSKRIKLTSDSDTVDSTLSNFPALVYLSTSSGISSADVSAVFDEIGSNCLKIAVTQSDGIKQCYVEIEKWDSANEKAWLWVKMPSVPASADTDIYLYYDNNHADNSTYVGMIGSTPGQNVWDSNFDLVCHMADDTTSTVKDSTSNGNNGTKKAATEPVEASGKVADGQDFDGSDDYIKFGDIDITDAITVEIIANITETDGPVLAAKRTNSYYSWELAVSLDIYSNPLLFRINDNANVSQSSESVPEGSDAYLVGTYDKNAGDSNEIKTYIDGSQDGSANYTASIQDNDVEVNLGRREYSGAYANAGGIFSEFRISKIARSAAWIKATRHTCWDSFFTFGSEENAPADIELIIPAFAASAALLSTPSLHISIPAMMGRGTLSIDDIFFGRFVQCDPLSSAASLTGKLAINLMAVLASQSELKGSPEFQLLTPALAGEGILSLSDIFIGNYVAIPAFEASGDMNCDLAVQLLNPALAGESDLLVTPCIQLALGPFSAVGLLLMASVNKFNIENAEIYYTFVLTGENDGTTDITIPISSFQARLRSGDPTYLSVVIPGTDYAGAISARPNGEMIVYMNYYSGELLLQKEEIIRADLENINTSKGAKSRSIVLTGHKTMTTGGKTITLRNPTYRNLYQGKYTYRCATPDIFLRPGDTVICGDDAFDVELITYVVSVAQQSMEITGA